MSDVESDAASVDSEAKDLKVNDLMNPDIVTKYRLAADIANRTLKGVLSQCVAGKDVAAICAIGDSLITKQCANSFKSKKIEKGIAFPTCISVNECVCHFSPLPKESVVLKAGDMVKIDLGCHIDGYIALVAHTAVVDGGDDVTGSKADVVHAAATAVEAAFKLARPGNKSSQIVAAVERIAEEFGVTGVQGTLSQQMKRFVIDGTKVLSQVEDKTEKPDEFEFEANEVYALDFCMTTGEGKPKEGDARTTVFKRAVDQSYRLKMKASRYVINEVNKKFATLPFTIRAMDDEKQARMGVVECVNHQLLQPYKVVYEKAGAEVAHFKATILVTSNGTTKITGLPVAENVVTDKKVGTETQAILALKSKKKKKRGKKKKAAAAAAGADAAPAGGAGAGGGAGAEEA